MRSSGEDEGIGFRVADAPDGLGGKAAGDELAGADRANAVALELKYFASRGFFSGRREALPPSLGTPNHMKSIAFALVTGLAAHQSCHGISMLHTTNWNSLDNTNPYIAEGAKWDSVGFVQWASTAAGNPSFVGTGTLVPSAVPSEFKFLTAAHNVDSEGPGNKPDGVIDALNFNIFFGSNTGADGENATGSVNVLAANIAVHPFWTNGDGTLQKGVSQYDLAVMTFTVSNVTSGVLPSTLQLGMGNPINQIATMVGYGSWGNGQSFIGAESDGIRRAGQNMVDVFGTTPEDPVNQGITIQSDFDGPGGIGDTIGSDTPLALEASTAGGDSGGPLIVNGAIVGVLNGGFSGTGGNLSEYGDRSVWAPINLASNLDFLTSAGVLIPEPGTSLLTCVGLCTALLRRRRK